MCVYVEILDLRAYMYMYVRNYPAVMRTVITVRNQLTTCEANKLKFESKFYHKIIAINKLPVVINSKWILLTLLSCFQTHLNKHNGVLPYACPHCDKRFLTTSAVKKHISWKHSDVVFTCPHCPHTTKAKNSLQEHIRSRLILFFSNFHWRSH